MQNWSYMITSNDLPLKTFLKSKSNKKNLESLSTVSKNFRKAFISPNLKKYLQLTPVEKKRYQFLLKQASEENNVNVNNISRNSLINNAKAYTKFYLKPNIPKHLRKYFNEVESYENMFRKILLPRQKKTPIEELSYNNLEGLYYNVIYQAENNRNYLISNGYNL